MVFCDPFVIDPVAVVGVVVDGEVMGGGAEEETEKAAVVEGGLAGGREIGLEGCVGAGLVAVAGATAGVAVTTELGRIGFILGVGFLGEGGTDT